MAAIRAATSGSPGDANGSRSMMTQLSASPATSTPCQKLAVASSTAFGVARKSRNSADARRRALHEQRPRTRGASSACTSCIALYGSEEHERAALRPIEELADRPCRRAIEFRRPRIGHFRRQIEQRLRAVVELGWQPECRWRPAARAGRACSRTTLRPSSVADVSTVAARSRDHRVAHDLGDVDRRRAQRGHCGRALRRSARSAGRRRRAAPRRSSRGRDHAQAPMPARRPWRSGTAWMTGLPDDRAASRQPDRGVTQSFGKRRRQRGAVACTGPAALRT